MKNRMKILASVASGAVLSIWSAAGFAQSAPQASSVGSAGAPAAATQLPMAPPTTAQGSAVPSQAAFSDAQMVQSQGSPSQDPVVVAADGSQPAASDGQWVYLNGRGWTWLPGGAAATEVNSEPYVYVYTPTVGWNWVVSPWGWGPYYAGPWALGYGPGYWGGYYHYGPGAWGGWHGGGWAGGGWGGGYHGGWGGGSHGGWGGGGYGGRGWSGGGYHGGAPSAAGGWGGHGSGTFGSHPSSGGFHAAHPHVSSPRYSAPRSSGHFGGGFGGGGHFGGHGGGGHGGGGHR